MHNNVSSFTGGNIRKPILNDLYFKQSKIRGITTDINAVGNAVNVKTLKEQLANYLRRDGIKAMTGDLDIGFKNVLNLENLTDYKLDDPIDYRIKDLKSVVNKEYLSEKFLKVDKDGNDFDLKQKTILFGNNDLVSKAFVDAEISKLPKPDTDVLILDGSKAMTGSLSMDDHPVIGIRSSAADNRDLKHRRRRRRRRQIIPRENWDGTVRSRYKNGGKIET